MKTKVPSWLSLGVAAAALVSCGTPSGDPSPDGGSGGSASPGTAGTQGSGGMVGTGGSAGASNGGDSGSGGGNGGGGRGGSPVGTGGGAGTATGATGGAAATGGGSGAGGAAGSGASGRGGTTGTAGAGGSGGAAGAPHVTVQLATSVPSQYRSAVANPGKWTSKTYPVYYYTTEASGSASQTGTIPRQSTPITKPCNVYTPPNYDPQTEYPLIFVLHGITDNQNTWMERGDPKPNILLDNLITSKVIKPVIAVFPQGDSKSNYATNTSYSDTAGYYRFGNELMNDLVPFIEANYSVKKDRGSRAISGFSMGGMQTINVGLCQNLKNFAWFGAFDPAGGNFSSSQIPQYLQTEDAQTYPVYYFYISVGKDDTTAGTSAMSSANGLTSKTPYITAENFSFQNNFGGGHVYPTATIGLYNFLRIAFSN